MRIDLGKMITITVVVFFMAGVLAERSWSQGLEVAPLFQFDQKEQVTVRKAVSSMTSRMRATGKAVEKAKVKISQAAFQAAEFSRAQLEVKKRETELAIANKRKAQDREYQALERKSKAAERKMKRAKADAERAEEDAQSFLSDSRKLQSRIKRRVDKAEDAIGPIRLNVEGFGDKIELVGSRATARMLGGKKDLLSLKLDMDGIEIAEAETEQGITVYKSSVQKLEELVTELEKERSTASIGVRDAARKLEATRATSGKTLESARTQHTQEFQSFKQAKLDDYKTSNPYKEVQGAIARVKGAESDNDGFGSVAGRPFVQADFQPTAEEDSKLTSDAVDSLLNDIDDTLDRPQLLLTQIDALEGKFAGNKAVRMALAREVEDRLTKFDSEKGATKLGGSVMGRAMIEEMNARFKAVCTPEGIAACQADSDKFLKWMDEALKAPTAAKRAVSRANEKSVVVKPRAQPKAKVIKAKDASGLGELF